MQTNKLTIIINNDKQINNFYFILWTDRDRKIERQP